MIYEIIIDSSAKLEIIESIEWYNKRKPGLGIKFYKQVQRSFKSIRKNPFSFAVRYKESHTATLKTFPYLIHFIIENNKVVVTSVLHTSRDPNIWDELEK